MIDQIKNIYIRRFIIVVAFPFLCIALILAWLLDWFYQGFKGFRVYSKDVNKATEKSAYELGCLIRESWNGR